MIKINKIKYDEMTPYFIDGLEKPMFTAAQIARAVGISESTVLSILSKLVFTRHTLTGVSWRFTPWSQHLGYFSTSTQS